MASAKDMIVIGGVLLTIGLLLFVVHFTAGTLVSNLVSIPAINQSTAAVDSLNAIETSTNRFDILFLGFFIGFILSVIITGWFIGGEPAFMLLYFIVAIIAVPMSMVMSNVWYNMTQSSVFGLTVNAFPITNHVLSSLPIYMTIIGILGVAVTFSKPFVSRAL